MFAKLIFFVAQLDEKAPRDDAESEEAEDPEELPDIENPEELDAPPDVCDPGAPIAPADI